MGFPIFNFLLNFKRSHSKKDSERAHSMMAGLNQKIFLNQWGKPETQVSLNPLGRINKLGTMFLITDPAEETPLNVWIYKNKDSILFFTKEKLVFHLSSKKLKEVPKFSNTLQ